MLPAVRRLSEMLIRAWLNSENQKILFYLYCQSRQIPKELIVCCAETTVPKPFGFVPGVEGLAHSDEGEHAPG